MWNSLDLQCPSNDVCKYNDGDVYILNELPNLVDTLNKSAEILTADNAVWAEMKVFQNVQAKYKRILHCDKCLQYLQKIGSCVRKMRLLNLTKSYLVLAEHILLGLQSKKPTFLIPSSQQLEFVLIRTVSLAKLTCEALRYSREAFCYLLQRLSVGHLISSLLMATSVTARINVLSRGLLLQLFEMYGNLYTWLKKLKKGTHEWPRPAGLPEDLETWLKPDTTDLLNLGSSTSDHLEVIEKLLMQRNNQLDFRNIEKTDEDDCVIIDKSTTPTQQTEISNAVLDADSDTGEIVPRSAEIVPRSSEIVPRSAEIVPRSAEIVPRSTSKKKLSESQQILLQKIRDAKSLKRLHIIWKNFDVTSGIVPSSQLTPDKIQQIEHLLTRRKFQILKIKKSHVTEVVKAKAVAQAIRTTSIRFAKCLGLIGVKSTVETKALASPSGSLQPAKNPTQFKQLYESLYQILQTKQEYEQCNKLRKMYKSTKKDLRLLVQNGEKSDAKKLIACTSKIFLTKFKN